MKYKKKTSKMELLELNLRDKRETFVSNQVNKKLSSKQLNFIKKCLEKHVSKETKEI